MDIDDSNTEKSGCFRDVMKLKDSSACRSAGGSQRWRGWELRAVARTEWTNCVAVMGLHCGTQPLLVLSFTDRLTPTLKLSRQRLGENFCLSAVKNNQEACS